MPSLLEYFSALELLLFDEACDGQVKDPFALEADVSHTAWDPKPFLHRRRHGSLHLIHSSYWDLVDSKWPHYLRENSKLQAPELEPPWQ